MSGHVDEKITNPVGDARPERKKKLKRALVAVERAALASGGIAACGLPASGNRPMGN